MHLACAGNNNTVDEVGLGVAPRLDPRNAGRQRHSAAVQGDDALYVRHQHVEQRADDVLLQRLPEKGTQPRCAW